MFIGDQATNAYPRACSGSLRIASRWRKSVYLHGTSSRDHVGGVMGVVDERGTCGGL